MVRCPSILSSIETIDNTAPLFNQQIMDQTGLYLNMGITLEDISFSNLQRWYASLYKAVGVVYSPKDQIPYFYELIYTDHTLLGGVGMISPLCLKIQHPYLETSLVKMDSIQHFHNGVRNEEPHLFIDSTIYIGQSMLESWFYTQESRMKMGCKKRLAEVGQLSKSFLEDETQKGYVVYDYKTPNQVYTDLQDWMYLYTHEHFISPFEETVRYGKMDGCPDVLRRILHKFTKEPLFTSLQKFDVIGREYTGSLPVTTDYPVHPIRAENYPVELLPIIGYVNNDWCVGCLGKDIPLTDYHVSFKTTSFNYGAPVFDLEWEYGFDRFERDGSKFDYVFYFTKQLDGLLDIWKHFSHITPNDSTVWISIRKTFADEIVILFYSIETEEQVGVYYDDVLNSMVTLGCSAEYN